MFALSRMVHAVTESFSTHEKLEELKHFMAENQEQGSAAPAFKQAVEVVSTNIEWKSVNEQDIKLWLYSKEMEGSI